MVYVCAMCHVDIGETITHTIENDLTGAHLGGHPCISICFVMSDMDTGQVVGTSDKM